MVRWMDKVDGEIDGDIFRWAYMILLPLYGILGNCSCPSEETYNR